MVVLLNLSSWCLVMVEWLFLAVPWGCLRFVIVVFPDYTHLLFLTWNTIWESDKKKHAKEKRSAFSQQVITMVQGTDRTA